MKQVIGRMRMALFALASTVMVLVPATASAHRFTHGRDDFGSH